MNDNVNYIYQIEELRRQLNEEKNNNQKLLIENNNLKEEINRLNKDINKIQEYKNKIKSLENDLIQKNNEIQQLLSQNNNIQGKYKITSGNQEIGHYGLVCKNTDLFIREEKRLYEDFPNFKKYETYFEVNGKRIKRFQTLSENNIKDKDIINIFIIEE